MVHIPLQWRVNNIVVNLFLHIYSEWIMINKTVEKFNFCPNLLPDPPRFWDSLNQNVSILDMCWCNMDMIQVCTYLLSSINVSFLSKVIIHQRSSSIKGNLPSKVMFHQRLSSIKGRLQSKVIFRQNPSAIKGCLPSKVLFHQRSFCIKGRFPLLVALCLAIYCDLERSRRLPYHTIPFTPLQTSLQANYHRQTGAQVERQTGRKSQL